MLRNYFKIAWRNLQKNKTFSGINILGLSIGISICFIIMLFVQQELSYDKFNTKADRTYRIAFKASINGGKIFEANVMPPVAGVLKKDFPEVEEVTRINLNGITKVTYKDKTFKEEKLAIVDSNFFSVFSLPFLKGDPATALMETHTIVLTKEKASSFFGTEDPIGKLLEIDKESFKVTGVIEDIPVNAHFHFNMFVALSNLPYARDASWLSSGFFTYAVLKKGYDYKKLEAKFPNMVKQYMGPQIQQNMGMSLTQFRGKGNDLGFVLQPLTSIHLYSSSNFEFEPGGDIRYVYVFAAVAIFMLLIACINFINLSTAGASKRAREVGIRKVMGSARSELIKQFLLESAIVTGISIFISIILIKISLPVFNDLSGKNLHFIFTANQVMILLAIGIIVSVLAGLYPAFFLSSFKPITTLKGKISAGTKSFGMRSSLVVFQFFISVCLITGTIVVYQQMKFIQNTKLGYDKDQLLVLSNSGILGNKEQVFKQQLLKDPRILNATISGYKPAGPSYSNNALANPVGKENQVTKTLEYNVDEQYIPTLGIQMATGRNFSSSLPTDSLSMIINESAARIFGWNENTAIGQQILRQNTSRGNNITYRVIGVVKDFHFKSLHETITPLLMVLNPESGIILKIKTRDIAGLVSSIKQQWSGFNKEEPLVYEFMDDLYNKTYSAEQKTGRILNIFAALTILVACMGLFGLATYTAEQRSKEIGIRKVLGASVTQVTQMLSKEFLKLVLIGCLIAFPLSYWAMHAWLQDFAYRIDISWWVFLLAAVAALFIALFTVSFQAIKAALANPVDSLRSE